MTSLPTFEIRISKRLIQHLRGENDTRQQGGKEDRKGQSRAQNQNDVEKMKQGTKRYAMPMVPHLEMLKQQQMKDEDNEKEERNKREQAEIQRALTQSVRLMYTSRYIEALGVWNIKKTFDT